MVVNALTLSTAIAVYVLSDTLEQTARLVRTLCRCQHYTTECWPPYWNNNAQTKFMLKIWAWRNLQIFTKCLFVYTVTDSTVVDDMFLSHGSYGLLYLTVNGENGTVCDDYFDRNDNACGVVCMELGYKWVIECIKKKQKTWSYFFQVSVETNFGTYEYMYRQFDYFCCFHKINHW